MDKLYELKDKLMKELEDYSQNGKFSRDDVETIKYMASAVDHLCNIMDDEEGYSGRYPYMGGVYSDGRMDGRSSRRSYKRDSMGRYSRDGYRGYSRNDLADKMRELMDEAPDDRTRQEIQRMVDKLENV